MTTLQTPESPRKVEGSPMPSKALEFHPIADIFPLMEGAEFDAFVADIKTNTVRDPVVLYQKKILDGRNRYRACVTLGIEVPTIDLTEGEPVAYVISKNVHRRHLSDASRAVVAAKLETAKVGRPKNGGNPPITRKRLATLMNVTEDSIKSAHKVLAEGTPEEVKAVEVGAAGPAATAKAIRERSTRSPAQFKTPTPPAVTRDDASLQKTNDLRKVAALVFTSKRHTPRKAATLLRSRTFERYAGAGLADRLDTFAEWIMEIAKECRQNEKE